MQWRHDAHLVVIGHNRQLVDVDVNVYAGVNPSAGISRQAKAQLNRLQHRIYTSTPIYQNKFNKQKHTQQRCCMGTAAAKNQAPTFAMRLKAIVLLLVMLIICLVITYINGSNVQQFGSYVQAQLIAFWNWSEGHRLPSTVSALLSGFIMAIFSCGIIYLDSAEPGLSSYC